MRITASVLLFLTISEWAVSRFTYVPIAAEWIRLDVSQTAVVVFVTDWREMSVRVSEPADHLPDISFSMTLDYDCRGDADEGHPTVTDVPPKGGQRAG